MHDQQSVPNCARCGDRVGVYERMWFERRDGAIESTSLLNLRRDGLDPVGLCLWHQDCAPSERIRSAD